MNRTTTEIRPPAAALRLLLAVVLAIGLMPLPAFTGQASANDLAAAAYTDGSVITVSTADELTAAINGASSDTVVDLADDVIVGAAATWAPAEGVTVTVRSEGGKTLTLKQKVTVNGAGTVVLEGLALVKSGGATKRFESRSALVLDGCTASVAEGSSSSKALVEASTGAQVIVRGMVAPGFEYVFYNYTQDPDSLVFEPTGAISASVFAYDTDPAIAFTVAEQPGFPITSLKVGGEDVLSSLVDGRFVYSEAPSATGAMGIEIEVDSGGDPQPAVDPVKAGNAKQGDVAYAWSYGGNVTYDEGTGYTVTPYTADGVTYVIDTLVVDGQAVELSADQAKAAYTLQVAPTSSVFATFAYTVNFNSPDNGTLSVARAGGAILKSGDIVRGGEVLTIDATPADGYEMDGDMVLTGLTAVEGQDNRYRVTAQNGDATPAILAKFKEAQPAPATYFAAVADGIQNGTVSLTAPEGKDLAALSEGDVVTVTATPDEGYELESVWYYADDPDDKTTVEAVSGVHSLAMPAANVTVGAKFKQVTNDVAAINLADAPIAIYEDGYSAGGSAKVAWTGAYVLSGSAKLSGAEGSAVEVVSGSHEIALDSATITYGGSRCAVELRAGAEVDLELRGNSAITCSAGQDAPAVAVVPGARLTIARESTGSLSVGISNPGGSPMGSAVVGGFSYGGCGTVEVRGGMLTVSAWRTPAAKMGSSTGAAIGSGDGSREDGKVLVSGGTVRASASSGAAIGSGANSQAGVDVEVSGGKVVAESPADAFGLNGGSAAIGAGRGGTCGDVLISGGTVEARSGPKSYRTSSGELSALRCGAAIGCGSKAAVEPSCAGNVTITGGTVTAVAEAFEADDGTRLGAAAIGSGYDLDYGAKSCLERVEISGGTVRTSGVLGVSPAPVGADGEPVYLAKVPAGAGVSAVSVDGADWRVSSGYADGADLCLYLPASQVRDEHVVSATDRSGSRDDRTMVFKGGDAEAPSEETQGLFCDKATGLFWTVAFEGAGGSAVGAQAVKDGACAAKPEDPTREYYEFTGWTLGGEPYDFSSPVTGDITLMASWARASASVAVSAEPGGASVEVRDAAGAAVAPGEGGAYALVSGEEYSYAASGEGLIPKSGTFVARDGLELSVALDRESDYDRVLHGGEEIADSGTYRVAADATGTISVVGEGLSVTLVGSGAGWDRSAGSSYGRMTPAPNEQLYVSCAQGTKLTLRDLYVSNGTGSGGADGGGIAANTVAFAGAGNELRFEGTVVLDHNGNASGKAAVRVPAGAELLVAGAPGAELFLYKREQGAGIGGDAGESCGAITFGEPGGANDFRVFAKGSKQGAVIGNGADASGQPGDITFNCGLYDMQANARGALIGGAAGASAGKAGDVHINGGLLSLTVDYSGAAIGGGGFEGGNDREGGNAYLAGGSVRTYVTANGAAAGGWGAEGVTDKPITATKLDAAGSPAALIAVPTDGSEGAHSVSVDDAVVYSGPLHSFSYTGTKTGTPGNWAPDASDANLYVYAAAGEDHQVAVDGAFYKATWDAASGAFAVSVDEEAQAAHDAAAAAEVEALIDAIPDDPTTEAGMAAVQAALDAYDGLTDSQKALVSNLPALLDAQREVAAAELAAAEAARDAAEADAQAKQAEADEAGARAEALRSELDRAQAALADAQAALAEAQAEAEEAQAALADALADADATAAELEAAEARAAAAQERLDAAQARVEAAQEAAKVAQADAEEAQAAAEAAQAAAGQAQAQADAAQAAVKAARDEAAAAKEHAEASKAEAEKQAEAAKAAKAAEKAAQKTDLSKATVTVAKATYTGKALKPKVTVKLGSKTLKAGTDYSVSYANNKKAGTGVAVVAGKGSYAGAATKAFAIAKAKGALTVKALKATVKATYGKKKAVAAKKAFKVTANKSKGKVTYKKTSGDAKIKVSSAGKVTVAKGLAAGTYTVKVKATAKATANYKKATAKAVTFKVRVAKAKNTLTLKGETATVKAAKVKRAAQKLAAAKVVTVAKNASKAKLTYKKLSGSKKIAVSKAGKVTVQKGLKKGTYKVKVKVTSKATKNYKAATKTVTFKVKVK